MRLWSRSHFPSPTPITFPFHLYLRSWYQQHTVNLLRKKAIQIKTNTAYSLSQRKISFGSVGVLYILQLLLKAEVIPRLWKQQASAVVTGRKKPQWFLCTELSFLDFQNDHLIIPISFVKSPKKSHLLKTLQILTNLLCCHEEKQDSLYNPGKWGHIYKHLLDNTIQVLHQNYIPLVWNPWIWFSFLCFQVEMLQLAFWQNTVWCIFTLWKQDCFSGDFAPSNWLSLWFKTEHS